MYSCNTADLKAAGEREDGGDVSCQTVIDVKPEKDIQPEAVRMKVLSCDPGTVWCWSVGFTRRTENWVQTF